MNEPAPDEAAAPKPKKAAAPKQVAKIRCLDAVKAKGFTFAKGKVVEGVPLAHAEFLKKEGTAEILEVSNLD